jgi:aspartate kinase
LADGSRIVVQKFGGTSVDREEHRRLAAAKVIAAKQAGLSPVVVVSAIGRRGAPYATDTLVDEMRRIDPNFPPHPREMDMMMACGEIISTAVMAATLQSMGHPAIALSGGQAGIITDGEYGNARILEIHPTSIHNAIDRGLIPVVCGFQGVTTVTEESEHGSITTLGRGGSDTTASALGAALRARAVEIYTDVDGVKTADPDMVPDARTLDVCTYEEVAEIAHQGAKVVHPRAAELAMDHGIEIWVKSTFTDHPGTRIVGEADAPPTVQRRITGVTHTGKLAFIRLEIGNEEHKPFVEKEVYRLMARAGVNILLVSFSPTALSFAVNRDAYPIARDLLDGMVVPVDTVPGRTPASYFYIFKFQEGLDLAYRNQRPLLSSLEEKGLVQVVDVPGTAHENGTIVSVIANKHRQAPGVMASIFETMAAAGIPVLQVSDSEMSISVLVPETEARRAVRLLHDRFRLGEPGGGG